MHRDRAELADTLVGTDEDDAVAVALAATRFADLVLRSQDEPGQLRTEARWLRRRVRRRVRASAADRGGRRRPGCSCWPRCVPPATSPGPQITRADVRPPTSSCGASWSGARRATSSRARRRCWPSPPGRRVTARWPGARSTARWRSIPTTRWPTCVAELLTRAVPPDLWEPTDEADLPVLRAGTGAGPGRVPAEEVITPGDRRVGHPRVRAWGRTSTSRSSAGADRTRHREKVRRCLDVFARMLREAPVRRREPDDRHGDRVQPRRRRGRAVAEERRGAGEDRQPDFQTELAQFNLEINVLPRRLGSRGVSGVRGRPARQPQPRPRARPTRSTRTW